MSYNFNYNNQDSMASLCSYLSMLSYENTETQQKWFSKLFSEYDFVNSSHKSLQYSIIMDNKNKYIFFVIRGTDTNNYRESLRDILVSMKVWHRKIGDSKFHTGYSNNGDILKDIFLEYIHTYKDYHVVFTGHSLGGVIAKYIATNSNNNSDCYTYGAPRLSDNPVSSKRVNMFNYINVGDSIPLWYPSYKMSKKDTYYILPTEVIHHDKITDSSSIGTKAMVSSLYKLLRNTLIGDKVGSLAGHSIKNYIRRLKRNINEN